MIVSYVQVFKTEVLPAWILKFFINSFIRHSSGLYNKKLQIRRNQLSKKLVSQFAIK